MAGRTHRSSAQGFTLLELLVVICLIGVLLVTLVPTLTRSTDLAKGVTCLDNQKTITRGLLAYTAEWGVYPYNYRTWDPGRYDGYVPRRFALECLSTYVGGPVGKVSPYTYQIVASDLTGMAVGQFPKAYICPSADQTKVFAANPGTLYHACYWSNIAVRVNKGDKGSSDNLYGFMSPNDPTSTPSGLARWMQYCPNDPSVRPHPAAHWRNFYYPRPENVRNPGGTMFSGDTNNNNYVSGDGTYDNGPGMWELMPGWGYIFGGMGFDRHGGCQMVSYLDGHARPFYLQEAIDATLYPHFDAFGYDDSACGFMVQTVGEDGCGGTLIHTTPAAVCH